AIAFGEHTGVGDIPFAVAGGELDFRDPRIAEKIFAAVKTIQKRPGVSVVLLIIDTISRALCGGDENSPKDMGAVIRTVGRIGELTEAHVLCVHHSPADGANRQRGNSSLKGSLDTAIHVEKVGATRRATVTKANDSEEGESIGFTLKSVEIYRDEDGKVTAAPVV